ncbi:MAG: hypothetical protein LQ351_003566 [Letrouitia transgressa]|nr:MAG: hypothetical protein LQ351_003566 [Letrouitia transgressa]
MAVGMSFQSGNLPVPSVETTWPSFDLLKFPPAPEPQTLRPPVSDFSLARPFNIDPGLYNDALHTLVPISIATVYAVIANYVNNVNKRRENKPWAISRSGIFYVFVLLHNIFLAAFSAWTFVGMLNAIANSWPGLSGERGFARAADSLCKIHGPRGYGSAATFNPKTTSWGFTDTAMKLEESLPDTTDVGRLWNEGLAFYGWLFYISKFYEVMDTAIVLAKGKNTAFFQTYHHAGAMMCMWAGIRYMSPPIWMFVLINSGIHALMVGRTVG